MKSMVQSLHTTAHSHLVDQEIICFYSTQWLGSALMKLNYWPLLSAISLQFT
jgi:hypothetical protein